MLENTPLTFRQILWAPILPVRLSRVPSISFRASVNSGLALIFMSINCPQKSSPNILEKFINVVTILIRKQTNSSLDFRTNKPFLMLLMPGTTVGYLARRELSFQNIARYSLIPVTKWMIRGAQKNMDLLDWPMKQRMNSISSPYSFFNTSDRNCRLNSTLFWRRYTAIRHTTKAMVVEQEESRRGLTMKTAFKSVYTLQSLFRVASFIR